MVVRLQISCRLVWNVISRTSTRRKTIADASPGWSFPVFISQYFKNRTLQTNIQNLSAPQLQKYLWKSHTNYLIRTDKYPDNLDEAAENEITARYAILVRNKKSFDSRKKLEIDSIVVQSPLLKHVLGKVLKDYPGKSKPSRGSKNLTNIQRCYHHPKAAYLPGSLQSIHPSLDRIHQSHQ